MTPGGSEPVVRAGPRRRWRGLLFALLPLLVLLALSEGVLWLLGAGDPAERRALRAGFDEDASYFVPDPAVPGGWRTQMFVGDDEGSPEVVIPPKGPRLRVLLFGGSNTEGFPTEYIEEQLQVALDGAAAATGAAPAVEVINLGRHGYGSERIRILFRQALVLQPDVAFVYMGHNEFVERGYAMELAQQWGEPWQAQLADGLAHLRTLNVLVAGVKHLTAPPAGDGSTPEGRDDRSPEFDALQWEQTQLFYEVYRRHYEDMLALAADEGLPLLISTVISNDFDPPTRMNFAPTLTAEQVEACRAARGRALDAMPARFLPGLVQRDIDDAPIHLRPPDWGEALSDVKRAWRLQHNAGIAAPVGRTLRPPLDHGPFWSDRALWSDKAVTLITTFSQVVARDPTEDERRELVRAVLLFEVARALVPDHPYTLFEEGLCVYMLGQNTPRAERLLRDAARFDRSPTHGNDLSNGIVRELAAAHPECAFVDAEQWMRDRFPDHLIGYEVMLDNCHMHHKVLPFVMDQFVPELAKLCQRAH